MQTTFLQEYLSCINIPPLLFLAPVTTDTLVEGTHYQRVLSVRRTPLDISFPIPQNGLQTWNLRGIISTVHPVSKKQKTCDSQGQPNSGCEITAGGSPVKVTGQLDFSSDILNFWPVKLFSLKQSLPLTMWLFSQYSITKSLTVISNLLKTPSHKTAKSMPALTLKPKAWPWALWCTAWESCHTLKFFSRKTFETCYGS